MKLKRVELELCSEAKECKFTSCPHIKPHETITKGKDQCAISFCVEAGKHVSCARYVFKRKIVETLP